MTEFHHGPRRSCYSITSACQHRSGDAKGSIDCGAEILRTPSLVSSVASPAKSSTPARPGKRRYACLACYYFCYYFEGIWGHLVTAYNHGIPANRKGMLKTRDIPTLTCLSPPTHQLGLQSPLSARFLSAQAGLRIRHFLGAAVVSTDP